MKKFIIFLLCVAVIGGGSWFGYKRYMDKKQDSIVVDVVPVQNMMQPAAAEEKAAAPTEPAEDGGHEDNESPESKATPGLMAFLAGAHI